MLTLLGGPVLSLNVGWLLVLGVAIVFYILYPLVLAIIANRRLHVSWRYFGFGALIFFVFQLITRVPAVFFIQNLIAPQLKTSTGLLYAWLIILALTAGLFEEVGRYVGYRVFMRKEEKTWNKAVMYGLGHGGLECMLYVGGLSLLTFIGIVTAVITLNILPAQQRVLAIHQLNTLKDVAAWTPLLGIWERLWTLPVHVALSVMVLQVFRRNNIGWLFLAILAHAFVDFTAIIMAQLLGPSIATQLLVELAVAIFGAIGLWIIWKLRDRPLEMATAPVLAPEESAGSAEVVPEIVSEERDV